MGKIYEWNENPFKDYLFMLLMEGNDLTEKELEVDVYVGISTILENFVSDSSDIKYLDFNIYDNNGYFKVVGNNIITALWLSGIFPENLRKITNNEFIDDNIKYKFNLKTKKLTQIQINDK